MVPCYLIKSSISNLSKLLWSLSKNSLKDLPNQLPITPGETMDLTLMGIISKLQIRTFLLCWVVGHFNFALTICDKLLTNEKNMLHYIQPIITPF